MGPAADSPPEGAGLARSGLRLVGRFARMEPWPFALALFGGTAWAATVVGSTIVIGQVNDKAIVPVLAGGKGRGGALWAGLGLLAGGGARGGAGVVRPRGAAWAGVGLPGPGPPARRPAGRLLPPRNRGGPPPLVSHRTTQLAPPRAAASSVARA